MTSSFIVHPLLEESNHRNDQISDMFCASNLSSHNQPQNYSIWHLECQSTRVLLGSSTNLSEATMLRVSTPFYQHAAGPFKPHIANAASFASIAFDDSDEGLVRLPIQPTTQRYVRFVEILVDYMPEIAHAFITFLALEYAKDRKAESPDDSTVPSKSEPEVGSLLESMIFGGVFVSITDCSGRPYSFMVKPPFRAILQIRHFVPILTYHRPDYLGSKTY